MYLYRKEDFTDPLIVFSSYAYRICSFIFWLTFKDVVAWNLLA